MKTFVSTIEALSDWAAKLSALILGGMTLLILLEIFLWNIFEKSTLIADEYSAYGLATIIFLGAGYCLKEKGHIRITLVLGFMPSRFSVAVSVVATALTTVFMGCVWWYLFKMIQSTMRYHSTSGTLTHTPLWIPQIFMLIGATCFMLQLAATTVKLLQRMPDAKEVL